MIILKSMARTKTQKPLVPKSMAKKKKIEKVDKGILLDNKVSIKKLANQKEALAQFPSIRLENGTQVRSLPVYRKDKLHYTPGFSLPDQFTDSFTRQQQLLQQYRISSQTTSIDVENIKQPKPSSRNSYCTICKIRFEEYKEHIEMESHLNKMRASAYNKLIEQMCEKKKIQRFLMNSNNGSQSNSIKAPIIEQSTIFQDDYCQKSGKNFFGANSTQALYQSVRVEVQQLSPNNNQSLFNVLKL